MDTSALRVHVVDGRGYLIDRFGIIRDPGRFKAQPAYAPYFWDSYLDGTFDDEYDTDDCHVVVFNITDDDRVEYPELAGATLLYLTEDPDGAVHTQVDRHE